MKRLTTIFLSLFLMTTAVQVAASPIIFQEGVSYRAIKGASSTYQGGKVDVVEMLWYGCQTCYVMQPELEQWAKNAGQRIAYRKMPAVTEESMVLLARAYYAAEVLGVKERIHKPLFAAIHESRRQIASEADVIEFFEEQGVAAQDFERALNSHYVSGKLRRARMMSERYGINGAPSVIVDGQYLVDPSMVSSPRRFIEVIDFLVTRALTTKRP